MNLLDERDGRKVAKLLGLKVTGVLGILLRAKQKGELFSLVEIVDALVTTAGFRIAPDLLAKDLQIVFQVLNKSCCPSSNKL